MKKLYQDILALSVVRYPMEVINRYGSDNAGFFAAGMSFFLLLSFLPMVLMAVAIFGYFLNVDEAITRVHSLVNTVIPSGGVHLEVEHFLAGRLQLESQLTEIVDKRGIAGILGLLAWVWSGVQVFVSASVAMNAAFEVKETRSWLAVRGISFGLMLAAGLPMVVTVFLSSLPAAIARFQLPIGHPLLVLTVAFEGVAVLVNAFFYVLIFKHLPNARVGWKAAIAGGLTSSVFFEVAKKGLSSWLLRPNQSVYGDLANLILFVLWIYYSMVIMLVGAEVAAVYQRRVSPRSEAQT
jgi:membrane protein